MLSRRTLLKTSAATLMLPLAARFPRPASAMTELLPAWKKPVEAGVIDQSSPVLYDVDGDGQLEIIVASTYWDDSKTGAARDTQKARIVILKPDSSVFQYIDIPNNCRVESSIAVGRLLGPAGDLFLVVGLGAEEDTAKWSKNPGSMAAFRQDPITRQFSFAYSFAMRDTGPTAAGDGMPDPVFSTPCLVDVDNDGVLEVFFGSWDHYIYLIKPTPTGFTKVWDKRNGDTVWSSGAAADVNGDGFPELFIGADISIDQSVGSGVEGGFLYCFDRFGNVTWRNHYPEAIYSSPAIADVDGDGQYEVVVGTAPYYGRRNGTPVGNFIVCCAATNGFEKWRAATNGHGYASPAVGNVLNKTNPATGLPILQVACGTIVDNNDFVNNQSKLYLIDGDGSIVWSKRVLNAENKTNALQASPIIVMMDYNMDDVPEPYILQPVFFDIVAFNAAGDQVQNFHTDYSVFASPAVADIDGDGKLELVMGCSSVFSNNQGVVYRFNMVNAEGQRVAAVHDQPWPMFRRNTQRTGFLPGAPRLTRPIPVVGTSGILTVVFDLNTVDGSTTPFTFELRYLNNLASGQSVGRQAPVPEWITATQLTGQVTPTPTPGVQVSINRGTMPPGSTTHQFELEIYPSIPGTGLAQKMFKLPITRYAQVTILPPALDQVSGYA